MKRCFRLTRSNDFKRVRRSGKSYAHPLVVLYVMKSDPVGVRVGVSAGLAGGIGFDHDADAGAEHLGHPP